jgi:hypothetical protein
MNSFTTDKLTRRRTLGLLGAGAAGALAGCIGGGSNADGGGDETTDGSGSGGGPGGDENDGDNSGTNPAGSCASAFGDTDQTYEPPADNSWIVAFDCPMAATTFYEDNTSRGAVANFGYVEAELEGNYEHQLQVVQRGPLEDIDPDVGAARIEDFDDFEVGGTVTYDGSERTVAVKRTQGVSVIQTIGFQHSDGEVYSVTVQCSVGTGDPCPETDEAICERVLASLRPAA